MAKPREIGALLFKGLYLPIVVYKKLKSTRFYKPVFQNYCILLTHEI